MARNNSRRVRSKTANHKIIRFVGDRNQRFRQFKRWFNEQATKQLLEKEKREP
ncbi:hypothetical protein [Cytobacillus luteolus]|uniref:hypothetical protein n=1 Tax=Litchfieldia luteola TaxID=682179 RepID=UPI001AE88745|nr:hypothetical protein [Cytobacillus luteolus]MBP1944636.1 hypothetical protein [Cytobacillus luteolus]